MAANPLERPVPLEGPPLFWGAHNIPSTRVNPALEVLKKASKNSTCLPPNGLSIILVKKARFQTLGLKSP